MESLFYNKVSQFYNSQSRGSFPYFDKLVKKPFDVTYCLYKMKQIHWLL